jgi:ribosomal small subunit protein bTHX
LNTQIPAPARPVQSPNQYWSSKMGRGDKKTRKGKIAMRSYGNVRPHKVKSAGGVVAKKTSAPAKPAVAKKAAPVKKAAPKKAG